MFSPALIASTASHFVDILEPEVAAIANLAGANQSTVDKLTASLDALKASAAALADAETTSEQAPLAQRIVTDGGAVLNSLTALPLPPQIAGPVRIASMVFGFLPAIVGIMFPSHPTVAPSATA